MLKWPTVDRHKEQSANSQTKKELEKYSVEVKTCGKTSAKNEDDYFISDNTLCVIDGITPKGTLDFQGMSGGQYAAALIVEFLENSPADLVGEELVEALSKFFESDLARLGILEEVQMHPVNRPGAVLVCARVVGDQLIVTQVGDTSFRINGKEEYVTVDEIDKVSATKRIKAMKDAKEQNPQISDDELLKLGRAAIITELESQTENYQNNPDDPLGYGAIDGRPVPKKFIRVFNFNMQEIASLEIFSDGYFKLAKEPRIDSWEEAFREVEMEDPLKIGTYPSTKGSSAHSYTDDRTILIANFKHV